MAFCLLICGKGDVMWCARLAVFRNFSSANYFPQSAVPQITNTHKM